jgi:triosephosphate isomerase
MHKKFIYAANWKMNKSPQESIDFINQNALALSSLAKEQKLIICPSFIALTQSAPLIKALNLSAGAQDCSAHKKGAFTGQISATDIASTQATHCIIGHSETRQQSKDSNQDIAQKCSQLFDANLVPIICVGETATENTSGQTEAILQAQLLPIIEVLRQRSTHAIIAYEPIWAIGTGIVPSIENLSAIFTFLAHITQQLPVPTPLLYGGSISSKNALELKQIKHLEGFLIGGASLDFQELKKIVEC